MTKDAFPWQPSARAAFLVLSATDQKLILHELNR